MVGWWRDYTSMVTRASLSLVMTPARTDGMQAPRDPHAASVMKLGNAAPIGAVSDST